MTSPDKEVRLSRVPPTLQVSAPWSPMSWANLRRLQRIPPFHGQPGRFAVRAAIRGFELAAQSQFLTLFASLTPARAVLSSPLHACTGRLVHGLPAQATPKTPACKGPPPRGAPQVLRGRRCRSRSLRAPPRCSSQNLPETSPACAAAILRLSGARWRWGSTSPSRPDAHSPCPEPSTPSFARPRHSRASREVDVRLTCVAIVSCDHVVSVV